ncbi:MAG TPA: serine/threonine-protein kinase [Polyangia bacterium]|nr:serine/threonine-protein kinase [Polyangia bacterium]
MTTTGRNSTRGEGAGTPARAAFSPGDLVAERFLVVRLVGAGGLGEVYEVTDQALGGPAALKVLKPSVSTNPVLLERFRREIQNARRITHPNVCRVFDLGVHRAAGQHRLFVTMELLAGDTLASFLAARPALATAEALPLLAQLAAGLQAAHDSGVIHRDLKPANVMLVPAEPASHRVAITDFGLAISTDQMDLGLTETWELLGTPEYMAPELTKRGTATPATDVYALGLIAYEMLTKQLPFAPEATPIATVLKRRHQKPRPLRDVLPGVDPAWDAAVARCLEPEPTRRFQRPADFITALEEPPEKNRPKSRPRLRLPGR